MVAFNNQLAKFLKFKDQILWASTSLVPINIIKSQGKVNIAMRRKGTNPWSTLQSGQSLNPTYYLLRKELSVLMDYPANVIVLQFWVNREDLPFEKNTIHSIFNQSRRRNNSTRVRAHQQLTSAWVLSCVALAVFQESCGLKGPESACDAQVGGDKGWEREVSRIPEWKSWRRVGMASHLLSSGPRPKALVTFL